MKRAPTPELLDEIRSEPRGCNRFVANLLDMARVEAGALRLNLQATDLTDAVTSALHDTRQILAGRAIGDRSAGRSAAGARRSAAFPSHACSICSTMPAAMAIRARRSRSRRSALGRVDAVRHGRGRGLAGWPEQAGVRDFHRIEGSDRAKTGTGLGLAIVKGFAEAMGLTVEAANRRPARCAFRVAFRRGSAGAAAR